ncbi:MAG: Gfo/Idh/MocA family oxidoreductase [Saprospiraceae bacterium]|nr:Gfo/Idh/MocA family oxidoreductase [Saprospiraceae bacterium]
MEKIRWGIIGPGKIAHKMAQDLLTLDDAELVAVGSRSLDRAKNFAAQYSIPYAFGEYADIARFDEIDVIYIATPHHGHADHTIMCLRQGKGVLCEKPLAINSYQVDRMLREAQANQVFLMEAIWTRFLPQTAYILEQIANNRIGEVHSIKADFGFSANYDPTGRLFNPYMGGGALLDIGIYPVFLTLLLFGKPDHILANAILGATGVDEEDGILFSYHGGRMAHLHASLRNLTRSEAFIYGSQGYIQIHTRWHQPPGQVTIVNKGERPVTRYFPETTNGYAYEAAEVMACLRNGKLESDQLNWSFSRDLINVLDAIRQQLGLVYPQDGTRMP